MKIFLLLLFLLVAAPAQAATYYVQRSSTNVNNCALAVNPSINAPVNTIVAGIACLASGDTLNVRTGTYNERITSANFSVAQSGASYAAATTIQGYLTERPVLNNANGCLNMSTPGSGTLRYIIFKNLVCDGVNATAESAAFATSTGGAGGAGAVNFIKFDGIEVKNWKLTAMGLGGPFDNSGTDSWIINGNVHDNGTPAGYVLPGDTGPSFGHCFYISGARMTIENSECRNQAGWGIHQYSGINTVDNVYRYNYIHNTGQGTSRQNWGIGIATGSGAKVYNNIVANNMLGMTTDQANTLFANNTVYGNGVNVGCGSLCDNAIQLYGSTNAVVRNNIIYNNSTNSIGTSGATSPTTSNNPTAAPTFAGPVTASNAPAANFALLAGSTSQIDQGFNVASAIGCTAGSTCVDYAGVVVPQSGVWDVGAYEFSAGSPPFTCPVVSPALVASYGFEGNGNDTTGVNTATLGSGWSYVAGKYGQGVISTGVSGITVADADALDPCSAFTYEGWISVPSVSGNYAFINKNPDAKAFLFASSVGYCGSGNPLAGYTEGSSGALACYSTALTTGSFQHLAVTYDSTLASGNIKIFLNGTQVTTADGTARLNPTTGTLQFCNSSFGEICPSGTIIDEVRIYNYARNAGEITTDMNTPVVSLAAPTLKLSGTMKFGASSAAVKVR